MTPRHPFRRDIPMSCRVPTLEMGWLVLAAILFAVPVLGEVIHLHNGDILHGTVVGATKKSITLETAYGELVIPKADILQIEYQGAGPEVDPRPDTGKRRPEHEPDTPQTDEPKRRPVATTGGPIVSLDIRGKAFWYAFSGSSDDPADARIRLRLYLGDTEAALLVDPKHDTVDGDTLYNSFTFSPTDTDIVSTADGYACRVVEAEDGRVHLVLELPPDSPEKQLLVRMLYQVNEGSREFPGWVNAVSRSFPVPVRRGMETYVVLDQDAGALEYSGFFRKKMKNLEAFELRVLSSEVRELGGG